MATLRQKRLVIKPRAWLLSILGLSVLTACGMTDQQRQEAQANQLYVEAQLPLANFVKHETRAADGEAIFQQALEAYDKILADHPGTEAAKAIRSNYVQFHSKTYDDYHHIFRTESYDRRELDNYASYYRALGVVEDDPRFYTFINQSAQNLFNLTHEQLTCGLVVDLYSFGDFELAQTMLRASSDNWRAERFGGHCMRPTLSLDLSYVSWGDLTQWLDATGDFEIVGRRTPAFSQALAELHQAVDSGEPLDINSPAYEALRSVDPIAEFAAYRALYNGDLVAAFRYATQLDAGMKRDIVVNEVLYVSRYHKTRYSNDQLDAFLGALHTELETNLAGYPLLASPLQLHPDSSLAADIEKILLKGKQASRLDDPQKEFARLLQIANSQRLLGDDTAYDATLQALDDLFDEEKNDVPYFMFDDARYMALRLFASVGAPERFDALVKALQAKTPYANYHLSPAYMMLAAEYERVGAMSKARSSIDRAIESMPREESIFVLGSITDKMGYWFDLRAITDEQRQQIGQILLQQIYQNDKATGILEQQLQGIAEVMPQ
uniref:hypothetical protein n=1 Tax=Thaumasiovibrio occultus TaxID=1891184 RepID=UPI00131C52EA|nr:hypothetical protein [Thaumasiovibrio occultus]